MKTPRNFAAMPIFAGSLVALFGASCLLPLSLLAQAKKNPSSKVYFADVAGEAQIDTGEKIEDVAKRNVYTAEGTVIETKKSEKPEDKGKVFSTMVYSNGTGAYFDEDTRVEVKKFAQEPFIPNRSDVDVEPSISQTQAYVARGTVGLCSSKLVAGSNMTYNTAHGSINVKGRKVVIEAGQGSTTISMLEGSSTVRGGSMDMGGHLLRAGEQVLIRPGAPGQPNILQISQIPPQEMSRLDDKVAMACAAKKTVYFEVRERQIDAGPLKAGAQPDTDATAPVTAFDGDSSGVSGAPTTVVEIVPVPLVPANLPVQYTVSPATLPAPRSGKSGG